MPIPPHDGTDSTRLLNRPLAIVGMACRLPGADGLAEFWELLRSGSSAIERMPDDKLNRELYFDPVKGRRGKTYSDIGGFISQREVDWSVLPFDRSEAANWDRCHLILCEVAAAACRDAGWNPRELPHRNGAVFVGHSGGSTLGGELAYRILAPEYVALLKSVPGLAEAIGGTEQLQESLLQRVQAGRPERSDEGRPYTEAGFAAGIVSRALGLTGPHMSIDAACASSLVALALAAATLQTGQSDIAIVGGASYNKSDSLILFSQAQSCSASGSRPFDDAADGLISSEGYVAIVLKTLERAQADGDRVHAVIHGIGVSSDGRGKSLWAPRKEGQYAAIGRAYSAEVTPASVQMVEAHATSTQVGDATEMEALSQFFREQCTPGQKIPVGSVKSNIGHTLETAGLAGLVKAVLSIQNATVPPSINVRNLSKSIPWSQIPLYVPHACEAWPTLDANVPRRAAVNAFGIGGLNVHVVVEQYLNQAAGTSAPRVHSSHRSANGVSEQPVYLSEPIAVIGRGMVLPGAANVEQFGKLLRDGNSQIGSRDGSMSVPEFEITRLGRKQQLKMLGGHVRGFEYDWRKHKVPPKQIAQANPLQFMLLEAAEQALREGRCDGREFDRQNTAVVVGSIFGGDFGNALFAGLRLPEFKHHLMQLLQERGVDVQRAREFATAYEDQFLKLNPALLDETGSFTSSTLASRLSKTFDLMGGALAIDSGDVSSFAALQAASQLLQTRAANQVLCAAAHRSLDRAAMETLARLGCLPSTNADHSEGYFVGEGVAVVLLKRLSDARRDGDRVWATIDGIAAGFDARAVDRSLQTAASKLPFVKSAQVVVGNGLRATDDAIARGLETSSFTQSPLVKLTGHLQATQGLADLIATTIERTEKQSPTQQVVLAGHTLSGQSYVVSLAPKAQPTVNAMQHVSPNAIAKPADPARANVVQSIKHGSKIFRFAAENAAELQSMFAKLSNESFDSVQRRQLASFDAVLDAKHVWRAAIVCDPDTLASKLALASQQIGVAAARVPMSEQGIFWSTSQVRNDRVAWLFPGQGSQYRGMLEDLVASDRAAANALATADALLASMGQPSFAAIAGHSVETLGEDVWLTQAAMLVADWIMLETLRSRGFEPSLVTGHSYGEFAAMLAAGCWDLAGALRATWCRCQAIVQHVPVGFAMLSIQSDAARVQELLSQEHFGISISHINAAQQIVVGGRHAAVVEFAQLLDDAGIASRLLAVPTAFHTPALQPAQAHFQRELAAIEISPPRVPLLSSITNCYEAEPARLAENLVQQLVRPIDFVALSERFKRDRVGLAIEVGPQQVLTRLLRQNVGEAFPVVSCDQPKRSSLHQLLCVEANLELLGASRAQQRIASASGLASGQSKVVPVHFDATQVRRERMRASGRGSAPVLHLPAQMQATVVNHDATVHTTELPQSIKQPTTPQLSSQPQAVPPQSHLQAQSKPAVQPAATHAPKFIETFLIDFVVEQTGYPAEIIELDWDIEADLGIDSIKKAQLFGELREFFDLESLTEFSLDSFRTLRDIATLLEQTPGKTDWMGQTTAESLPNSDAAPVPLAPPTGTSAAVAAVDAEIESPAPSVASSAASDSKLSLSTPQLTQFLIDFVVEQTGYPEEIVELDADLEADLGIDSIKKAQLFGELREMFQFTAQPAATDSGSRQGLADYRTLRNVLDAMIAASPDGSSQSTETEATPVEAMPSVDVPVEATLPPRESASNEVKPAVDVSSAQNKVTPTIKSQRDWPAIVLSHLGNGSANVASSSYRDALHANLRAMIGRRAAQEKKSPSNGHRPDAHGDAAATNGEVVNRIALAAEASVASVRSLSHQLLSDVDWQRCGDSSQAGLLVELRSPSWIEGGGGEVAAVMLRDSADCTSIAIGPAGSAMPMAAVHRLTMLVVGGMIPSESASVANCEAERAKLSEWIASQSAKWTLDECVRECGRLRLSCDWWMLLVDAESQRQAMVESREGVLVIERSQVASTANAVKHAASFNSAVGIGIDTSAKRYTLLNRGTALQVNCADLVLNEAWLEHVRPRKHAVAHATVAIAATEAQGSGRIASRYELQMSPAAQRSASGRQPEWAGAALVVGDNPIARQLEARLRTAGVSVTRLAANEDPQWLAAQLVELSKHELVKHLFIATPCDADAAISLDESRWQARRNKGLMGIFWLCQRWLNQIVAANCADDSSLVAISAQGGDFGFSGNLHSAEGGGVGGLLKSILIEGWMQGIRTLPIKVIDTSAGQSPAEVVDCVWRELAVPSYDLEVAYIRGVRHVVRAIPRAVSSSGRQVPRGGTWVCTGGARGITAFVTEELAKRYGLKLHLLGTAPMPQFDPSWRDLDEAGTRRLKAHVMTSARDAGLNPVKSWQNTEKALEIDATMRRFAALGIESHYHCCDVADRTQLRATLETVRRISGPIEGVLHGAGVGKDARFDRKQAEKVNQCIAAKVDGSLALMDATQHDPLKYFVGFGSISGRFGANGHTDYSLSNEMLCKQIDWFKRQRPEVKAIGFHWHAWGDVGMATKPETRLALEMIDMQFMPAQEGMQHLIAELEGDSNATEVLITDDKYYRSFYPAETLVTSDVRGEDRAVRTPMLVARASRDANERVFTAKVDPARDPFLAEHKLESAPLLPFVAAAEMLMEAAMASLPQGVHSPAQRVVLQDVEAVQGLRFFSSATREIKIKARLLETGSSELSLHCDFVSRDGRLVEADRTHFKAKATTKPVTLERVRVAVPQTAEWMRSIYPAADSKFYVGWPFQRLRKFTLTDEGLVGRIAAPALIELAGSSRDLRGWQIPCAAMDSCLFAVGVLAWQRVAAGTALPVRFGRLEVGRLPSPGEACEVHTRLVSQSSGRACFDFTLYGIDGDVLLNASEYEVAWLQAPVPVETAQRVVRGAN